MSKTPPMKLFWSSRSPFVRKAMIAAHETGVLSSLETVRVEVSAVKLNPEVMAKNPLNKIPTLLLPDGEIIFDSRVICEYFDSLNTGPKLFPSDIASRMKVLRREAIGSGIMENGVAALGENARSAEIKSQTHIDAFKAKIASALDYLEADVGSFGSQIDIGQISIAAALGYLDFRYADDKWRDSRPKLAAWHANFSERPSFKETEHANVY